ncbi:hypothetical protein K439DRAFT_1617658 [Ramaria rubella]|nr:hypothetical protein K439DRAFT_1617658 [Ramaria rubella]
MPGVWGSSDLSELPEEDPKDVSQGSPLGGPHKSMVAGSGIMSIMEDLEQFADEVGVPGEVYVKMVDQWDGDNRTTNNAMHGCNRGYHNGHFDHRVDGRFKILETIGKSKRLWSHFNFSTVSTLISNFLFPWHDGVGLLIIFN